MTKTIPSLAELERRTEGMFDHFTDEDLSRLIRECSETQLTAEALLSPTAFHCLQFVLLWELNRRAAR